MAAWTSDEVARIGAANILYVAARRADGTLRPSVPIWAVAHDGGLYVRSVNGRDAAWFRATQVTHEGHVRAGGVDKDVTFAGVSDDINDALDAAYRTKYRNSTGIDHIQRPAARAATWELLAH
jgi:hypothetical protein